METKAEGNTNGKIDFILLVDDDAEDNLIHTATINDSGVAQKVECFIHSQDAVRYLENCLIEKSSDKYPVPGLVFFDLKMPVYNGFELMDEFKRLRDPFHRKAGIKFVLLTGMLDDAVSLRAKADYGNLIIAAVRKPLTAGLLHEIAVKHF